MGLEKVKLCGSMGHLTRAGTPCGYKIARDALYCVHHNPDKTGQREMLVRARMESERARMLPEAIPHNALQTVADVQASLAAVVKEVCTKTRVDLKRMDVMIRALNAANAVLQTQAVKELNETVLRAEGHGPALVVLEGLKTSRIRQLPSGTGTGG